ncbi:MAG: NYN domain-containing protein [Candidatus Omnitrophica bacterium]|nr:NYN domain-containing protein [Candidatus Omnitrophota bacterium]MCM8790323.1 NYN domain-containing protein [Candidatus Omnitrophota bacterium]
MPIIIDGWNLIRSDRSSIKDDEKDSLVSASQLISYLSDFQKTHNDPIVLVFDSTREHLHMHYANSSKLTVVPTKDADSYIKRYIDKVPERQRRNLRVVSSDKDIFFYAKGAYATPLSAEDFWEKLKGRKIAKYRKIKEIICTGQM